MNKNNKFSKNTKLSFFSFFSFSASIIFTMLLFSSFATSGFNAIFFLIIGAVFWFVPISFASANMGSIKKWENGGIFTWVKNSLGERIGFVATFFQWFQSTIVYTILFYFLTSGINYLFDTNVFSNNIYKFILIVCIFLGMSLFQLFGIKITTLLSKISLFSGVVIPSILLIVLSFSFVYGTNLHSIPPELNENVIPKNNIGNIVIFSSFILGYTGIEESASNIGNLKNAKKNYPIIIVLVVTLIIIFNVLSSLSISLILPPSEISLSSSIFDTFHVIFSKWFGTQYIWISKVIAFLIMFGVIGQISSIISGPSKAISNSLSYLNAPSFLLKTNKNSVHYVILFLQSIFMIGWLSIITFLSTGDNLAFTICVSITSVIYLCAYLLMLIGYLKVTWQKEQLESTFFITNKYIKTIVAVSGILTTIFAMVLVFFQPSGFLINDYIIYVSIISCSIVGILIAPFILYSLISKYKLHISK
ncbi:MAG: APC family permease [Malacoplasma sp.]